MAPARRRSRPESASHHDPTAMSGPRSIESSIDVTRDLFRAGDLKLGLFISDPSLTRLSLDPSYCDTFADDGNPLTMLPARGVVAHESMFESRSSSAFNACRSFHLRTTSGNRPYAFLMFCTMAFSHLPLSQPSRTVTSPSKCTSQVSSPGAPRETTSPLAFRVTLSMDNVAQFVTLSVMLLLVERVCTCGSVSWRSRYLRLSVKMISLPLSRGLSMAGNLISGLFMMTWVTHPSSTVRVLECSLAPTISS
mmetsp:Transcript_4589/g.12338  ORF Transcript_4589/g.12338 Transcript_4589/m.12338 type:complete len:251 (-) Transcript_4589:288-1040(-)